MVTIAGVMSRHHGMCDALFAQCEAAVLEQRWGDADGYHARFCRAIEAHLGAEESLLFPAFESSTGLQGGPTQVMREEHAQMRGILEQVTEAISERQFETYADLCEMLLILIRQHNLKEENILYPLCDRSLAQGSQELLSRLAQTLTPHEPRH